MYSYKNGSLVRERVRDELAGGDWSTFNALLGETPRGNFGNIGREEPPPHPAAPVFLTAVYAGKHR